MSKCKFILDTNIILTAYQRYYAFDIAPTFWLRLNERAETGEWAIIDMVKDELSRQQDSISEWIKEQYRGEILPSNQINVIDAYSEIITAVQQNARYKESAKQTFADCADSWLVAHGRANNLCIVTEETFKQEAIRRVMIPNECAVHNVECIDTFEFMRRVGITM